MTAVLTADSSDTYTPYNGMVASLIGTDIYGKIKGDRNLQMNHP